MTFLRVGDVLDKYKVVKLLGEGGMAVVWLAERRGGGLFVVKELRKSQNFEVDVAAIKVEWRVLRQAKSDYVANLADGYVIREEGAPEVPLVVVEYVDGPSLKALKTPVSREKAFGYLKNAPSPF